MKTTRSSASRFARVIGALLCGAMLALAAGRAQAQTPFYEASAREVAGAPGTLIRYEPMAFAPAGAQAYRVLYRSTGMHGEPIAVSGVIVVPPGPASEGGRPIVACLRGNEARLSEACHQVMFSEHAESRYVTPDRAQADSDEQDSDQ